MGSAARTRTYRTEAVGITTPTHANWGSQRPTTASQRRAAALPTCSINILKLAAITADHIGPHYNKSSCIF